MAAKDLAPVALDLGAHPAGEGGLQPVPAIFLDRDGVLNVNRDDHVKRWEEFEWLPGVAPSLRMLREAGYALVVVTNQAAIGRGQTTLDAVHDIHRRMVAHLASRDASLDAILFCAHRPDEGCACRKPAPGMLLEAARRFRLDLARSHMVGDHARDLEAGRAAGVGAVHLVTAERPLWKVARHITGRI